MEILQYIAHNDNIAIKLQETMPRGIMKEFFLCHNQMYVEDKLKVLSYAGDLKTLTALTKYAESEKQD